MNIIYGIEESKTVEFERFSLERYGMDRWKVEEQKIRRTLEVYPEGVVLKDDDKKLWFCQVDDKGILQFRPIKQLPYKKLARVIA